MSDLDLFLAVEPRSAAVLATAKGDVGEVAAVEMSKAMTLSYQLPDAATEIRRLEELRRSLEKDLHKFKPTKRSEQAVLSDWLHRNEDLSLADVNLGDSDTTIKAISEEEVTGFGRYALRGDLRLWMDRVAALDANTPAIAGEWTAEDTKAIDGELHDQVRRVVAADVIAKKKHHIDLIQHICSQLKFISDGRNFMIDPEFVTDDTDQLRRLSEYIDDWQTHIERHGHPHKQTEAEVARRLAEAEAKRRATEQGLMAAGKAVGVDLTEVQLDQVLAAFYEQRQPANFLSKKEKVRLERNLVGQMKHTSAIEDQKRRFTEQLLVRIQELEATVQRLEQDLTEERNDPMKRRNTIDGLEQANATVRTAAEVLARKRIRESEEVVLNISREFEALLAAHAESEVHMQRLTAENESLKTQVVHIEKQWQRLNVLRQQQEEEMARLHGGRVSDLQRLVSTLHEVFSCTLDSFNIVVAGARRILQFVPGEIETVMKPIHQWCTTVLSLAGITEGVRAATKSLAIAATTASEEAAAFMETPNTLKSEARLHSEKEYIDLLVRKMDTAAGELQSNYREKRAMKSAIAYYAKLVGAICEGRYEEFVASYRSSRDLPNQVSFPPPSVLLHDEGYSACWSEEFRALERTILVLRTELHDTSDRTVGTNTLLHAVEVYGEAVHQVSSPTVEGVTSSAKTSQQLVAPEPITDIVQVKRDARMLLIDHNDERKRLKTVSATQMLRNIVQQQSPANKLPPLKSGARLSDLHRAASTLDVKAPTQAPPEKPGPSPTLVSKKLGRV